MEQNKNAGRLHVSCFAFVLVNAVASGVVVRALWLSLEGPPRFRVWCAFSLSFLSVVMILAVICEFHREAARQYEKNNYGHANTLGWLFAIGFSNLILVCGIVLRLWVSLEVENISPDLICAVLSVSGNSFFLNVAQITVILFGLLGSKNA